MAISCRCFRHSLSLNGVFHAGLLSKQTDNGTKQSRTFNQSRNDQHRHLNFGRHFRLPCNGTDRCGSHQPDSQTCTNGNQPRTNSCY